MTRKNLNSNELKHLINLSDTIICQIDDDSEIQLGNPAFLGVLNYSEEEFNSINYLDLIHPEDLVRTKNIFKNLHSGTPSIFSSRVKTREGEFKLINWSYTRDKITKNIPGIGHEVTDIEAKDEVLQKTIKETRVPVQSLKNLRILLAEDNLLNKYKVNLTVVNNGQEAVDIAKEKEFDIILLDLQMPVMDGYTATKILVNKLKIDTPIIAMTAHSLVGEQEKCHEMGMSGFLSKPYKANDLLKTKYAKITN